jgi:NADH:ubiquinone oxidoreductase subunit D
VRRGPSSRFFEAIAPVGLLAIDEKPLVHQAHLFYRLSPDKHKAAGYYINIPYITSVPPRHLFAPEEMTRGEQFAQVGSRQQHIHYRWKHKTGLLQSFVAVQHQSAQQPL